MKLRTWKYYIKQGFKGVGKNGLMSIASIIIVAACAFIVVLSLCIAANIGYMLEQVESKVGVVLYIGDKPTDKQVEELKSKIEGMDHVTGVKYKSADEALKEYGEKTKQDFSSFKDDNPLPRSLEVSIDDINNQTEFVKSMEELQLSFEKEIFGVKDEETSSESETQTATVEISTQAATVKQENVPVQAETTKTEPSTQPTTLPVKNEAEQPKETSAQMPEVVSQATTASIITDGSAVIGDADYKYQGIESIQHAQKLTEVLMTIDTVFKIVAFVLIAILCVIAIGIIMNTIKLTVFIRKNEINIMKYVGATDWFIRWPFVIEGIIIGIIGSAIPTVLCWLGYQKIYTMFNNTNLLAALGHLRTADELFIYIAPVTIGVGIVLGAIGSINSIRKHLKV